MADNLNEVIDNGKCEKFQFFVKMANGNIVSLTLPIEKKQVFENRFLGDIPDIEEYNNWLKENK